MSCARKGPAPTRRVVRSLSALLLACVTLLTAPAALAVDSGDIVVVSLKGEVHISVNGAARKMAAGSVLDLPALLRTGRDGAVELRQGATTLSVGPETLLEFPALEKRGAPIDRIVQPKGNVFYNIGKREGRKLRIETPFLVGVVKGTQFNVAAQDETTTISLFEGSLEVHAADESGVVDLKAGEIASRQRSDKGVNVSKMESGKAPTAPSRQPPATGTNPATPKPAPSRATPRDQDSMLVDNPAATVGTAASVVGAEAVQVPGSVDVSVSGPSVDVSTTVDAGPVGVDLVTATNVDVGTGTVDTGTTAGVTAGPITADVGVGAVVDLDSGTTTNVVVEASAPPVDVSVGSDVAADAVAGTVNVGVDVAVGNIAVDPGVNVDLGLDDGNNGNGNDASHSDSSNPGQGNGSATPTVDVGGLLDGLVHGHKKK